MGLGDGGGQAGVGGRSSTGRDADTLNQARGVTKRGDSASGGRYRLRLADCRGISGEGVATSTRGDGCAPCADSLLHPAKAGNLSLRASGFLYLRKARDQPLGHLTHRQLRINVQGRRWLGQNNPSDEVSFLLRRERNRQLLLDGRGQPGRCPCFAT